MPSSEPRAEAASRAQVMHGERHKSEVVGWLRAAVLGANDGIVSTASLLIGLASAASDRQTLVVAGIASLVAGAMAMAAGEYVSVHSQADTEQADLARERQELRNDPAAEHCELAASYVARGLQPSLADEVARQLMAHNALAAHARDELGMPETVAARPVQAALSSAASFAVGAALPLLLVLLVPSGKLVPAIALVSVACLGLLGALAAHVGGAARWRAASRVSLWGAAAMGTTALIGHFVPGVAG